MALDRKVWFCTVMCSQKMQASRNKVCWSSSGHVLFLLSQSGIGRDTLLNLTPHLEPSKEFPTPAQALSISAVMTCGEKHPMVCSTQIFWSCCEAALHQSTDLQCTYPLQSYCLRSLLHCSCFLPWRLEPSKGTHPLWSRPKLEECPGRRTACAE